MYLSVVKMVQKPVFKLALNLKTIMKITRYYLREGKENVEIGALRE